MTKLKTDAEDGLGDNKISPAFQRGLQKTVTGFCVEASTFTDWKVLCKERTL